MMLLECQSQSQCHRKPLCRGYIFFFFTASKTHTEKKKKLQRINKVIKRKNKKNTTQQQQKTNSEFTHLHGNILTNIKIRYISANSIYFCT